MKYIIPCVSCVLLALSSYFSGKRYLFILQQLSYSGKKYLKYIAKRQTKKRRGKSFSSRQRLDLTKRVKRIIIFYELTIIICFFIVAFAIKNLLQSESAFLDIAASAVPFFVISAFTPIFVFSGYLFELPTEFVIQKHYEKLCEKRLKSAKYIIGITGSFAKTTVKKILAVMLSEKYSVFATPASYNTPMGITKCVLQSYKDEEIAIIETGARKCGDIKRICRFVKPTHAVITAIGESHLESFKTIENVKKAKSEILQGKRVKAAFFGESAKELAEKYDGEKLFLKQNFCAENVKLTLSGTSFALKTKGFEKKVNTCLIGQHNIDNILLAAEAAKYFGVDDNQIASAIEKLSPVPHRLELVKSAGYVVLDDSYNANPKSVVAALEAIKCFDGKKFVITSGMVELGKYEEKENEAYGELLATSCDVVIIVGKNRAKPIEKGLSKQGFKKEKVFIANDLNSAVKTFSENAKEGDLVLFSCDLPDIYLS